MYHPLTTLSPTVSVGSNFGGYFQFYYTKPPSPSYGSFFSWDRDNVMSAKISLCVCFRYQVV